VWSQSELLTSCHDCDVQQLNDSAFVVSLLRTFIADPTKSLIELIGFYPHHSQLNAKGKETIDCQNKYFVMFQEQLKNENAIENKRLVALLDSLLILFALAKSESGANG
jgi:hypothetical protein